MAPLAWPSVTRTNVRHPAHPEAAGRLLLTRIGAPQAGGDRQVHQRVHGQGHDDHRAAEPVHPRGQRRPPEADHEVGDGEGHHDQHGPHPPAGQVGALDAPRREGADDGAQHRHHHGQADGVPQEGPGEGPPDEIGDRAHPGAVRLDQEEDQRGQQDQGHGAAGQHQRPGARRRRRAATVAAVSTVSGASVASTEVTSADSGHRRATRGGSQEPGLLQEGDGRRPVAELGDGDGVRLELVEGRLGLGRGHPRGDRVLEADRVGDDLLALLGDRGRPGTSGPPPGGCSTSRCPPPRRRPRTPGPPGPGRRSSSAGWHAPISARIRYQ